MRRITAVFLLAVGLLLGRSAFGATQVITNGEFGLNNIITPGADWSILPESTTSTGINFETGVLSMGNVPGPETQFVAQQVTIPANTLYALFSLDLQGVSGDVAGTSAFAPLVLDATGITILTNLGFTYNNADFGPTAGSANLTAFAGQTVDITFEVQIGSNVVDSATAFDISDVSLWTYNSNDIPANDDFTNSAMLNTTSNISVFGTNVLATLETGETNKIAGVVGGHSLWWNWTAPSDGVVTINTKGSACKTLLGVYTGDTVSNLTQVAANSGGFNSQVSFPATVGTKYQIAVDGANGAIGLWVELNLAFAQTAPTVTIQSPASGAKLTNSTVLVKGTASDKVAVGQVQVQLINANGTNAFQNATGSNSWTATVTGLTPGPNTINVVAYDTSGNASKIVSRTVDFIVVSPLTVNVSGTGTFSPSISGKLEDVGATLTLTAKPGTGQVFSNWTDAGGVQLATTVALTFTMQSNLVLQANFVPNPFTPLVGDYQGLFYDTSTNGPEHASSGFFNVTVSSSGSYSAKVIVAGVNYSLSGQFSAGGVASNNIVRKGGLPAVSVQMQLDLSGSGITGVVTDGTWLAQLNADRVATSAGAAAGRYTLDIPGVAQPGGDSYGTLTVSSTGSISFSGALADGTKVTQKANLTSNGQWAFYIPLYSGNGSIFGWLNFNDEVDSDITGTVDWFKRAGAIGKLYPGGFTNVIEATGSVYLFTNGAPVMNWPAGNGIVLFTGGDLPSSFENDITLSAANKITNDSATNALTATITTSTGLFTVKATDPATGKQISGSGVVLQKQNMGSGFFTGTNQTGVVLIGPPL